MKKALCLVPILVLAACNPDAPSTDNPWGVTRVPPVSRPSDVIGPTTGDNAFPWNRYFVTEFDQAALGRIRALPGYVANRFSFNLSVRDHPVYGGFGGVVTGNPLAAARLDYALSTGLTGAGQVVSMIDSSLRLSHDQFAGKTIYSSGQPPPAGEFHGTAVASVMVGTGQNGGTLGFAPGADLHQGYLNYNAPVNWHTLGQYMRDAASIGAIASNNSWGLRDATLRNTDVGNFVRNTQPYVDGLRSFAADGVIVFALQNDYAADSASLMAGLPLGAPELEASWISVINAIPTFDDDGITSAVRISTACLETGRFCMAANGQIKVATESSDSGYAIGVGASFAAPQVAGSIALLAEAFPDLTATQLRNRLLVTADNGFFDHDDVVTFAPGIVHGYNAEFGHGFLDLRAALLPIGQAVVPLADGGSVDLGNAVISAGSAVGDSLAQALAAVDIVTTDQMAGHFMVSGAVLAAPASRSDPAGLALMTGLRGDMGAGRRALHAAVRDGTGLVADGAGWHAPSGADLLGAEAVALTAPGDDFGAAALIGDAMAGVALRQSFDLGQAQAQVGVMTLQTDGSILGIAASQDAGDISAVTHALHLDVATKLAAGAALRLSAEIGMAEGQGAGVLGDVSTLVYDRIGLSAARADLATKGDVLSVFARQPIAITQGSARLDLPVQMSDNAIGYASHDIGLAPTARQRDLGFEYRAPLSRSGDLRIGMMHSRNEGNVTGKSVLSGFVGVQFRH